MSHAKAIGRLGGLAVGLGVGAAVAATAGVASADPVSPLDSNVAAASVDGVTGTLGTAADPAADPDIAISFSGITLFHEGTATATSTLGNLAIALGAGSDASAESGLFDTAFALDGGVATVGGGLFDTAFVDGDSAASATGGSLDTAFADGTSSVAGAFGGSLDTATVFGNDSAAGAGFGSFDIDYIVNTGSAHDAAQAGGSSATVPGSFDIASILGTGSTADAGGVTTPGNFDLAAVVFGDLLSAAATGGNFLADILP